MSMLSRVTTVGLIITNVCEMYTEKWTIYRPEEILFKLYYLNAQYLHKHFEDVHKDFNYSSIEVSIFSETTFSHDSS